MTTQSGRGFEGEHAAQRAIQAVRRLGRERAGGEVRIAEVGDEHGSQPPVREGGRSH